jgi:hypothetical protein
VLKFASWSPTDVIWPTATLQRLPAELGAAAAAAGTSCTGAWCLSVLNLVQVQPTALFRVLIVGTMRYIHSTAAGRYA